MKHSCMLLAVLNLLDIGKCCNAWCSNGGREGFPKEAMSGYCLLLWVYQQD